MAVSPTLKTSPFCPLVVGAGRGQLAEAWASREGRVGKNPSEGRAGLFPPQFCPGSCVLVFVTVPQSSGQALELPALFVLLSWGTQGHFLLVSVPATCHLFGSVLVVTWVVVAGR